MQAFGQWCFFQPLAFSIHAPTLAHMHKIIQMPFLSLTKIFIKNISLGCLLISHRHSTCTGSFHGSTQILCNYLLAPCWFLHIPSTKWMPQIHCLTSVFIVPAWNMKPHFIIADLIKLDRFSYYSWLCQLSLCSFFPLQLFCFATQGMHLIPRRPLFSPLSFLPTPPSLGWQAMVSANNALCISCDSWKISLVSLTPLAQWPFMVLLTF